MKAAPSIIVRLVWCIVLIALHHAWFGLQSRVWLLVLADSVVLFGFAHALVWVLRDRPDPQSVQPLRALSPKPPKGTS